MINTEITTVAPWVALSNLMAIICAAGTCKWLTNKYKHQKAIVWRQTLVIYASMRSVIAIIRREDHGAVLQ